MKVVIPMAGLGTRFSKVADTNPEYHKPKPFIMIREYPMVRWATGSLPFIEHPGQNVNSPIEVTTNDLTFVVLREHEEKYQLKQGLQKLYSDKIHVVVLDNPTRGAVETALFAKEYINPDEELIISDSDHFFDGRCLETAIKNKKNDIVGIIPVFNAPNDGIPRWSYSLVNSDNIILEEGEKDRDLMERGAYANIGAYYFSRGSIFLDEAQEVVRLNKLTGDAGKKEFYVAPLYKNLIEKGMKVQAAVVPEVWGLGTPQDLERFLKETNYLKPEYK